MKGSIITISFFVVGVLLAMLFGAFGVEVAVLSDERLTRYILYLLMFCVGVSIGGDRRVVRSILSSSWRIFLVPLATVIGTLLGAALISALVTERSLGEVLAVASGFGYYSLSSIFLTELKGVELGTVALVSNIIREIITLLFAPLLVRYFSPLALISSGGATTMDVTLPVITKYSGAQWALVAITHGVLVDLCVPFLVTFFAQY